MTVNLVIWLLAFLPIVVVLMLMVGLRWGASRAGAVGWLVALVVAVTVFGAGPHVLARSQLRAVLLTLYVLYIIWMALLLFNVVDQAGAIHVIGQGVAGLTNDRSMQLIILAWCFSAFLQGVAGFGVPIAVVAPLLIGLGFDPIVSVSAVAIGHSWSVSFGDMASSFQALMAVTGLSGFQLAPWAAIFLGVECLGCGIAAVHVFGGLRALRRNWPVIVGLGVVMSSTQYFLAVSGLWNLAGFVAGLMGLVFGVLFARLSAHRRAPHGEELARERAASSGEPDQRGKRMSLWLSVSPYVLLVFMVAIAELYGPVHGFLNQTVIQTSFPEVRTAYGWVTPAGVGRRISVFGHPGALLAYASILAFLLYRAGGHYRSGDGVQIIQKTVRSAVPSSIGIATMVGMALIMDHAGMTYLLAQGLSRTLGQGFPLVSPFIGVLGAFMTGSNTNSNVVFASLQQSTAELLKISALIILGVQTAGGSLGSMLAPAKVIVGCSTAGLAGQEGLVLRNTLKYGLLIAAVLGVLALLAIRFT